MDSREIIVTNVGSMEPRHKCEHQPYEYYKYEVAKRRKGDQCYVAVYKIPPGKANYPYHYHRRNEEVFYVISGHGVLETPHGSREISAGDIILCPPSEKGAHKITNPSPSEFLVYLDVDTIHSPEVVYYPHSGKMGVIMHGESNHFFKSDSEVDYYEGE